MKNKDYRNTIDLLQITAVQVTFFIKLRFCLRDMSWIQKLTQIIKIWDIMSTYQAGGNDFHFTYQFGR